MHGKLKPGKHLFLDELGTFFILEVVGIKRGGEARMGTIRPNGIEVILDLPIEWVSLGWRWRWKRVRNWWRNSGYVEDWVEGGRSGGFVVSRVRRPVGVVLPSSSCSNCNGEECIE
jgi:hypothetical protein